MDGYPDGWCCLCFEPRVRVFPNVYLTVQGRIGSRSGERRWMEKYQGNGIYGFISGAWPLLHIYFLAFFLLLFLLTTSRQLCCFEMLNRFRSCLIWVRVLCGGAEFLRWVSESAAH
ncbi:hypothetical protein LZ31DRAFT_290879 [Colletotrichum somersetense]|nr:hypothetical protein LZ31DRAFT_290879 [Colletotrichum somersetense]